MKKILFAIACSFLLTGCLSHEQGENTNKEGEENINTPTNDNGQASNNEEGQNNGDNQNNGEDNNQNNDSGNQQQGDEPANNEKIKTKTVSFYNGGFTNSSLDQAASQKSFIAWFNGNDDLLTSINYSGYAQMNYIGNANDEQRFSTLILGSQKQNGSIKFNFSKNIKSVKINIQGYCKYIAYSDSYSVDTDSKFKLDDETLDLSVSAGYTGLLERKDMIKNYETPVSSFTIASEGQRVFVHTMEISYIL